MPCCWQVAESTAGRKCHCGCRAQVTQGGWKEKGDFHSCVTGNGPPIFARTIVFFCDGVRILQLLASLQCDASPLHCHAALNCLWPRARTVAGDVRFVPISLELVGHGDDTTPQDAIQCSAGATAAQGPHPPRVLPWQRQSITGCYAPGERRHPSPPTNDAPASRCDAPVMRPRQQLANTPAVACRSCSLGWASPWWS